MKISIRKFARNAGWNVFGQMAPLIVAVVVLPHLIKTMGLDRYGFLTLVWVLVGYAGLFDFGIGRAVTRTVAQRLASGDASGARHVSVVGMTYMLGFGICVGLAFAAASPWLANGAFKIPPSMHHEALMALLLLAVSIPLAMLSAGYSAVLSAYEKFGAMNMVRAALGVASYIGPLAIVYYDNNLEYIVAFIAIMRFFSNRAYARVCSRECGIKFWPKIPDRVTSKELFSLGGWITVSNVVSPFLTYLDRLILGALVAMKAVAYYATPYDIVIKTLIVPYSIMGAVFPVASGLSADRDKGLALFAGSVRSIFIIMVPVEFILFSMAKPVLNIWLGADFATNGAPVVRCLAVGLLLNSLAQVPAMMIQAAGRPKWMALLHLVELPIFVGLLWYLTDKYGIYGTAVAATLRYGLDTAALYGLAIFGIIQADPAWRRVSRHVAVVVSIFGLAALAPQDAISAIGTLLLGLCAFCAYAWAAMLSCNERVQLLSHVRAISA